MNTLEPIGHPWYELTFVFLGIITLEFLVLLLTYSAIPATRKTLQPIVDLTVATNGGLETIVKTIGAALRFPRR